MSQMSQINQTIEKREKRKKRGHYLKSARRKRIRTLPFLLLLLLATMTSAFLLKDQIGLVGGEEAEEEDFLILVNRQNEIPADDSVDLTLLANGESVATAIVPALQQMFDDARSQGVYPIVASGYRGAEEQQALLDEKIAAYVKLGYDREAAAALAETYVSPPGSSEHQLGLAVDINADPMKSTAGEVYTWLAESAHQYGFILRYPEGKEELTGTHYEAWHYRYVGKTAASTIYKENLCLEEYIEKYVDPVDAGEEAAE